jgi:hypothetical protein
LDSSLSPTQQQPTYEIGASGSLQTPKQSNQNSGRPLADFSMKDTELSAVLHVVKAA